MRVEIGSIAFLMAAGGYLIGLDNGGHQVEARGDSTEQLIYVGTAAGWLVVPSLESP